MCLELTNEEKDLICEMIERRMKELRVEIHRTDSPAYRAGLEREHTVLVGLQERLPELAAP